jgi:hypothetical protein
VFRFILLRPDGIVVDFAMGAASLPGAFEHFARDCWRPEMLRSFGVWQNHARIARVLVAIDKNPGDSWCLSCVRSNRRPAARTASHAGTEQPG